MQNNNKNNLILMTILIIMITMIIGISYAYFNISILGNDDVSKNVVRSGNIELTLNHSASMNYSNLSPNDTMSTTFTVKNTGTRQIDDYNLYFSELVNTYLYDEMVYSITCESSSGTCNGKEQTPFGNDYQEVILSNSFAPNVTHTYVITVKWLETGSVQNYNLGQTLSYRLSINETNAPS